MRRRRPSIEAGAGAGADDTHDANAALAKMGYKSELPRNLSMLSVLGLSVK
jgi:hypothetical protein